MNHGSLWKNAFHTQCWHCLREHMNVKVDLIIQVGAELGQAQPQLGFLGLLVFSVY